MQIHAQLLIRVNTCRFMTESPEALRHAHSCSALDTGSHMMIQTNTCRYMPSAWHMQKHVYTRSALDTGQHIKILGQLLINAERCRKMPDSKHAQHMQTHSQLSICSNVCSPQCVQIHAKTCPALKIANARRYALGSWYVQTHAHTSSTLNAGKQIKTHAQPSICADTFTHARLLMQANK
jgi:hypothetical protein